MENNTPSPEIENELRRHIKSLIIFETKHISPYRDGMTNVIVSIPNLTALIAKFVTRSNRKAVLAEIKALKEAVNDAHEYEYDFWNPVFDARISQLEAEDK